MCLELLRSEKIHHPQLALNPRTSDLETITLFLDHQGTILNNIELTIDQDDLLHHFKNPNLYICPYSVIVGLMRTILKAYYWFNLRWVRNFSTNVWDRCQSIILRKLDSL